MGVLVGLHVHFHILRNLPLYIFLHIPILTNENYSSIEKAKIFTLPCILQNLFQRKIDLKLIHCSLNNRTY
jgi:hypothetical protein